MNNCSKAFSKYIRKNFADVEVVGIVPESNTKNKYYLEHLIFLGKCLSDAGYEVVYVSLDESLFAEGQDSIELESFSQLSIKIHRGIVEKGKFLGNGREIDFAILNHDQSSPLTIDWEHLQVPVVPTPKIGWFKRNKARHFFTTGRLRTGFAKNFPLCQI